MGSKSKSKRIRDKRGKRVCVRGGGGEQAASYIGGWSYLAVAR
jgi:hypothetical protein